MAQALAKGNLSAMRIVKQSIKGKLQQFYALTTAG
jgi:hypothetical protein